MTDWQRLEQVIKWTGLSTNSFASSIGLKRSENLYQIKRGNNRISKNLAELIAAKYPSVNRAWLLTDQGEMLMDETANKVQSIRNEIPYYNMDVLRVVSMAEMPEPMAHLQLPGFENCALAALAPTGLMDAAIPPGAILLLQPVESSARLLPDEIYVVVTAQYAWLRHLKPDLIQAGRLTLVTGRPDDPPVGIDRQEISRLFLIVGWVVRRLF